MPDATISAAIVYAHFHVPLRHVLREAHRRLDDVAKDGNDRDSVALCVLTQTGVTREWASKWEAEGVSPPRLLIEAAQEIDEKTSGRFFYAMREQYEDVITGGVLDPDDLRAVLLAEYRRSEPGAGQTNRDIAAHIDNSSCWPSAVPLPPARAVRQRRSLDERPADRPLPRARNDAAMTMLVLHPLDTLFFRDGRPYNQDDPGQAEAASVFPPHPPTVVGAVRAARSRAPWAGRTRRGIKPRWAMVWTGRPAMARLAPLRFAGPVVLRQATAVSGAALPRQGQGKEPARRRCLGLALTGRTDRVRSRNRAPARCAE